MTEPLDNPLHRQQEGKAASTRLLDMLAGWASYVAADEENGVVDLAVKSAELRSLYQQAGEMSLGWDHLSPLRQAEAVKVFVNDRVLALLLRGSA